MPMFSPTSQGLPATMGEVAEPETADGGLSGLAKRVSAYLARVVGALADFEDRLIREDGFFATRGALLKHKLIRCGVSSSTTGAHRFCSPVPMPSVS